MTLALVPFTEVFFHTPPLNLLKGAQLKIYERGTSTPATLYADEAGEDVIGGVVTDQTGRAKGLNGEAVWIEVGSYDVEYKGIKFAWEAAKGDNSKLEGMADVDVSDPPQGHVLLFGDGKWIAAASPEILVDAFGAKGDGAFDNTAVIQGLLDTIPAGTTLRFSPEANYLVGDLTIPEKANIGFRGAGRAERGALSTTTLTYSGTGTFVGLGTFSATPASYFEGKSQGFRATDLLIDTAAQTEGERTKIAIQDNGSGAVTLDNCEVRNFKYGFAAPYGSDFTVFRRSVFYRNDVGVYLGPGSQQVDYSTCEFFENRESVVMDSCAQGGMRSCWFIDSRVVDVQFEYLEETRFGLKGGTARQPRNDLRWTLDSCWHESGAVGTGVQPSNGHVRTFTDRTDKSYPRGVQVAHPNLVAGGPESTTRSFWECATGKFLSLDKPKASGIGVAFMMNRGEATKLYQADLEVKGGFTIAPYRNENFECVYVSTFENRFRGSTSGAVVVWEEGNGGIKLRWKVNSDKTLHLEFWTGTEWLDRMKLDPQNAAILFRDAEVKRVAEDVLGFGSGTQLQPPEIAAGSAKNKTLYIDSSTGKLMYKDASGTSNALY